MAFTGACARTQSIVKAVARKRRRLADHPGAQQNPAGIPPAAPTRRDRAEASLMPNVDPACCFCEHAFCPPGRKAPAISANYSWPILRFETISGYFCILLSEFRRLRYASDPGTDMPRPAVSKYLKSAFARPLMCVSITSTSQKVPSSQFCLLDLH